MSSTTLAELFACIERERGRLSAVIVHLNDTYLIEERSDQFLPGFARVTATVKRIRKHVQQVIGEDRTLVLHSGDFLGPSRVAKRTEGKVMVELLNALSVDYCVLGNHEFDYGERTLLERLSEANFGVLLANVRSTRAQLKPYVIWPNAARPSLAITGVVSKSVFESFIGDWKPVPEASALTSFFESTKSAPFHIVLTHAKREEDRELRHGFPRRTYVLGGHDHDIHWVEDDGPPLFKNLSNLQTVRVLLLLSGGISARTQIVDRALELGGERILEQLIASTSNRRIQYTFHKEVERLFVELPPQDVEVLRPKFPAEPPEYQPRFEVWTLVGMSQDQFAINHAIEAALTELPYLRDYRSFLLHCGDHDPPDPSVAKIVANTLGSFTGKREDDVICDLSATGVTRVDARDERLRRGPTDFGVFVAECARCEGRADIAIINAGAFRCDAELPAILRLKDLLDTFLYDSNRAIVVLKLPSRVVQAALQHGKGKAGSGAFPQISPPNLPARTELTVAISSYLVADPGSIDGYDRIISGTLGTTLDTLRDMAQAANGFSVTNAVLNYGQQVGYQPVSLAETRHDLIAEFIRLSDRLVEIESIDADSFRIDIANDNPLPNKEFMAVRDAMRTLLREIPEVKDFWQLMVRRFAEGLNQLTESQKAEIVTYGKRSLARLQALHGELQVCVEGFRTSVPYAHILNYAASGIGAWMP